MKETPSFIIHYHNTERPHYDITLKKNGEVFSWILPRGLPEYVSDRKIAVQQSAAASHEEDVELRDLYGTGESEIWDSGPFSITTQNNIKYIFSADGNIFKGKYLLHNPSWGRWTKRKLWVLEKVPLK